MTNRLTLPPFPCPDPGQEPDPWGQDQPPPEEPHVSGLNVAWANLVERLARISAFLADGTRKWPW